MEALKVLDQFTAAFNERDSAGMDAALHFPHFIAGPKPVVWTIAGKLPGTFFPNLIASGWAFSKYTKRQVVLEGPDAVHVLVEYQRCRQTGVSSEPKRHYGY